MERSTALANCLIRKDFIKVIGSMVGKSVMDT